MYEGSGTTRSMQIIAGILLGILTSLCLLVGLIALNAIIFYQNGESTTLTISLVFTPIGVIGSLIAKRLITAKGVKQGAGLLSPNEYKFLGYFFITISISILYYGMYHKTLKHIILSPLPLALTYLCFVAARFRSGMKNIPKWQNKRK